MVTRRVRAFARDVAVLNHWRGSARMTAFMTGSTTALAALSSGVAAAQPMAVAPAAPPDAHALLSEAHRLGKRGDFEQACVFFEDSARAAASADALLNAGICREYHGDLAGALDAFEGALSAAKRPRERNAIQPRIDALMPRVPSVVITPAPEAGTAVELDGRAVERFDAPLRTNPGQHQLRVLTASSPTYEESFAMIEGQSRTIVLPAAPPPLPPKPAPAAPSRAAVPVTDSIPKTTGSDHPLAWQKPALVGGVALFVGGVALSTWQFLAMSSARTHKHELSDEYGCNVDTDQPAAPRCDASIQGRIGAIYADEEEPARKRAWIGVAVAGAGGALAVASYVALRSSGRQSIRSRTARMAPLGIHPEVQLGPGLYAAKFSATW